MLWNIFGEIIFHNIPISYKNNAILFIAALEIMIQWDKREPEIKVAIEAGKKNENWKIFWMKFENIFGVRSAGSVVSDWFCFRWWRSKSCSRMFCSWWTLPFSQLVQVSFLKIFLFFKKKIQHLQNTFCFFGGICKSYSQLPRQFFVGKCWWFFLNSFKWIWSLPRFSDLWTIKI